MDYASLVSWSLTLALGAMAFSRRNQSSDNSLRLAEKQALAAIPPQLPATVTALISILTAGSVFAWHRALVYEFPWLGKRLPAGLIRPLLAEVSNYRIVLLQNIT